MVVLGELLLDPHLAVNSFLVGLPPTWGKGISARDPEIKMSSVEDCPIMFSLEQVRELELEGAELSASLKGTSPEGGDRGISVILSLELTVLLVLTLSAGVIVEPSSSSEEKESLRLSSCPLFSVDRLESGGLLPLTTR